MSGHFSYMFVIVMQVNPVGDEHMMGSQGLSGLYSTGSKTSREKKDGEEQGK